LEAGSWKVEYSGDFDSGHSVGVVDMHQGVAARVELFVQAYLWEDYIDYIAQI
jgi:hypothetical protein